MPVKLKSVKPSDDPKKKWNFTFKNSKTGRTFTRSVGAKGMEDYTQHHNKTRRKAYRQRHKKDLNTGDATRPGFISYYVLWGESTSFRDNLAAYKRRFHF